MQITLDASSHGVTTGSNTLTVSHTCTGTNLLLIVFLKIFNVDSISSVKYNSVNMSLLLTGVGHTYTTYVYYMLAPPTGAHNLTVVNIGNTDVLLTAASYINVNQITPFDSYSYITLPNPSGSSVVNTLNNYEQIIGTYTYDTYSVSNPTFTPLGTGTNINNEVYSNNNGQFMFDMPTTTVGGYTFGGTVGGAGTGFFSLAYVGIVPNLQTFTMTSVQGSFILSGLSAIFNLGLNLLASVGSYTLTGFNVLLGKVYLANVVTGFYSWIGNAITIVSSHTSWKQYIPTTSIWKNKRSGQ